MRNHLDNYLLELILMDTISVAGGRCIPQAERIIQRYVPPRLYDRIIARYDELSVDDDEPDPHTMRHWLRVAAEKGSPWKRRMVVRFLRILSAGGPIGVAELADVAALAARMNAGRECQQVYRMLLGWASCPAPIGGHPTSRRATTRKARASRLPRRSAPRRLNQIEGVAT